MRRTCVAVAFGLLAIPAVAQASTVPVDPGPIGKGRPILGTTQNLPSLDSDTPYNAGPGFAPQIRRIYESGQIRRLQRQVAQEAWRTIRTWVRHHCPDRDCRPAVAFDVDDTMLDNYREYAANDPAFSYNPVTNAQFALACRATAHVPVRRLYTKVVDAGLRVAVITGRPANQRAATASCLRQRGYRDWNRLITRSDATASLSSARFKANARRSLQQDGWTIVASVGDQVSDMSYGRLDYGFLLPNPMYFLP